MSNNSLRELKMASDLWWSVVVARLFPQKLRKGFIEKVVSRGGHICLDHYKLSNNSDSCGVRLMSATYPDKFKLFSCKYDM